MRGLAILFVTLSGSALACTQARIEAATTLVLQANPLILAKHQELTEQSRQRNWNASLTLGYSTEDSDESTANGANAAIRLEIPLFDRANELKVAKERTALQGTRDSILNRFLSDVEKLCSKAEQVRELGTMRGFYRDRLQYRQEQVKEGLEEAASLWGESEKVQQVENDYRRERGALGAMQLAVARRFGGEEWKRLQVLLADASR